MKKLLFVSLLFASVSSYAQEQPLTNIEKLLLKPNLSIKKELKKDIDIHNIHYQLLKVTDISGSLTVNCLRIEGYNTLTVPASNPATFLDKDEFDSFLSFVNYAISNSKDISPTTEFSYTSRSGFKAGVFNYAGEIKYYIQLVRLNERSKFELSPDDWSKLKDFMTEIKTSI